MKPSIPTLISDNKEACTNHDKAEMLNSLFTKSYNNSLSPLSFADLDSLKSTNEGDLEGILCHVQEVEHFLETLDTSKCNGCDGIFAGMLKSTAPSIAPSITNLFNAAGFLPVACKSSHVVPGDMSNPTNYRPISLSPILSIILEHHICKI